MPFCTYCGQSFTRDEHLERHILTHTNVKPYKCFTCHMSFARRDLLHRHFLVHGKDGNFQPLPASNGIIPKSAGRTPIACTNCAKTKTKCDKKFPCSRCSSRGLKCTARPTRRVSKNAPVDNATNAIVDGVANEQSGSTTGSPTTTESTSHTTSARSTPPLQITPTVSSPVVTSKPSDSATKQTAAAAASRPQLDVLDIPQGQIPSSRADFSPAGNAAAGASQNTPLSVFEDLSGDRMVSNQSPNPMDSPLYAVDWPQLNPGASFDQTHRTDMLLSPGMAYDPVMFSSTHSLDQLPFVHSLTHSLGPHATLQAPMSPPDLDRRFGAFRLDHVGAYHERQMSNTSSAVSQSTADDDVLAHGAWSAFRCNPIVPSTSCPKSAKLNLEKLERSLKSHDTWSNWRPTWTDDEFAHGDLPLVLPLQERARDKLLAITQSFLHKALEIHRDERTSDSSPSTNGHGSNFVILPPTRVLEHFMRSYANSFERYYPLTPSGTLNANDIMQSPNDKASSLLLLLMINHGALVNGTVESQWLTGGLTETCRISLFDLVERNILMASDPMVLHSALLFTSQAAWSGDKWHMDIAMGQRGMYVSMLRHSGMLEPVVAMPHTLNQPINLDAMWKDWVSQESKSRLVYSWAMVDQDLSLFHDTPPLLSVTEFGAPMPDSEGLWQARNAVEWSGVFEQVHAFSGGYSSVGSGARPLSLRDMFRHFMDDGILSQGIELTPLHLRLLLHPLQSLGCHYRQLMSCTSDVVDAKAGPAASARIRLEELQSLLQRWYGLADRYMKNNAPNPMMQANLAMFHLVSLNIVSDLSQIERLARREGVDGSYQQLMWLHRRCISDVEESIFHCGQVIRHVRTMHPGTRPLWWSAAIYRVSLVLWVDSLTRSDMLTPNSGRFPTSSQSTFAVDSLQPEHPMVVHYLTKREGTPVLTRQDGNRLHLDDAFAVLCHCVDLLDSGAPTRFSEAIKSKLGRLAKGMKSF